jgi:hypothetical protein
LNLSGDQNGSELVLGGLAEETFKRRIRRVRHSADAGPRSSEDRAAAF